MLFSAIELILQISIVKIGYMYEGKELIKIRKHSV